MGSRQLTPEQLTLLRGVLGTKADADDQLMDWVSKTDLDSVDASSHRLLPLLFRSLSSRNVASKDIDRLRGVYRKSWYRNQQHVAAAAKAIEVLDGAGIGHTLVAGLPVALAAYDDLGARTVYTTRLVVPQADIVRTIDLISKRNFRIRRSAGVYGWGIPSILGNPDGATLDVRDWVYGPGWSHFPDDDIWARRVPLHASGLDTFTLDAADTIVAAAAEAGSTRESWLQGLVDVALLARQTNAAVNWSQVSARYEETVMSVPLFEALTSLIEHVGVPVGSDATRWQGEYRARLKNRIGFWAHRDGRRLARLAPWYRRGLQAPGRSEPSPGFISFAAAVYAIESRADAIRRLRRRLTTRPS